MLPIVCSMKEIIRSLSRNKLKTLNWKYILELLNVPRYNLLQYCNLKITLRMTSNFRSRPFIFSNDAKNIWTVTSHKRMIIIIINSYSLFVDIKIIRSFLLSSAVDKSIKHLFALLYTQTLKEYAIQQWFVNACLSLSQNALLKHL